MAAKVSSHFEWGRARRARAAAKSASHRRASPEAVAAAAGAAAAAAAWTVKDDRAVLARLDALRAKRAATALAEKEKGAAGGAGAAGAVEEEEEDDDEEEVSFFFFCGRHSCGNRPLLYLKVASRLPRGCLKDYPKIETNGMGSRHTYLKQMDDINIFPHELPSLLELYFEQQLQLLRMYVVNRTKRSER